jgi:signal transduction histidine kinase
MPYPRPLHDASGNVVGLFFRGPTYIGRLRDARLCKFQCVGKKLRLVISDDGQGTEETPGHQNGKPSRLGIGIPGMMARMQQVRWES